MNCRSYWHNIRRHIGQCQIKVCPDTNFRVTRWWMDFLRQERHNSIVICDKSMFVQTVLVPIFPCAGCHQCVVFQERCFYYLGSTVIKNAVCLWWMLKWTLICIYNEWADFVSQIRQPYQKAKMVCHSLSLYDYSLNVWWDF